MVKTIESPDVGGSENDPLTDLSDKDFPLIREKLLIETVKSAFGESRGGLKRKPSDEAWEWILSQDQELPFSFAHCCREWGADPETMLEWLRYYRRKFLR